MSNGASAQVRALIRAPGAPRRKGDSPPAGVGQLGARPRKTGRGRKKRGEGARRHRGGGARQPSRPLRRRYFPAWLRAGRARSRAGVQLDQVEQYDMRRRGAGGPAGPAGAAGAGAGGPAEELAAHRRDLAPSRLGSGWLGAGSGRLGSGPPHRPGAVPGSRVPCAFVTLPICIAGLARGRRGRNPVPRTRNSVPRGRNVVPRGPNSVPRGRNSVPRGRNLVPRGRNPVPRTRNSAPREFGSLISKKARQGSP
eukprot:gene12398-biopygen9448